MDDGYVTLVQINDKGTVEKLIYYSDRYVTYTRTPSPDYSFDISSAPGDWALGQTYQVGDIMYSNGYVFRCIRSHTSGTTSSTRNPALRSNRSTWEVIGTVDDTDPPYSSTVRFGAGMRLIYSGKYYIRTDFNLVGGQVPYENRDSDYWILDS